MNSQQNEKLHFPPKRPTTFKFWEIILSIISGYEAIKISIFYKLVVKLWLTEDDDLQKQSFNIHPNSFIQK